MNFNIRGFNYEFVGSDKEGYVKDFMGNVFAIIEDGEVWKDGNHIGYLKENKKTLKTEFVSLMPEYNHKKFVARKSREPKSGWELEFFKNYGMTKESHPREAIQYKRWFKASHGISNKKNIEE